MEKTSVVGVSGVRLWRGTLQGLVLGRETALRLVPHHRAHAQAQSVTLKSFKNIEKERKGEKREFKDEEKKKKGGWMRS